MSSTKTNSELLVSIKQSNKVARESRAKKLGFAGSKELILYLELAIKHGDGNVVFSPALKAPPVSGKTKPAPTSSGKTSKTKPVITSVPTIHVIDILDASGSMYGGKISAANIGINLGLKALKEDKAAVKYTHTFCHFSDDVVLAHIRSSLSEVKPISIETRGSTALFDAIGITISRTDSYISSDDKVLVNIYTDGQENSSNKYKGKDISEMIERLSAQGWTFTFIGTDSDVKHAQSILKFHASNTLVYDGSAQGLEKSLFTNNVARSAYSKKVEKGEDVSTGFYKDIK